MSMSKEKEDEEEEEDEEKEEGVNEDIFFEGRMVMWMYA
jgi:hypothetical protein